MTPRRANALSSPRRWHEGSLVPWREPGSPHWRTLLSISIGTCRAQAVADQTHISLQPYRTMWSACSRTRVAGRDPDDPREVIRFGAHASRPLDPHGTKGEAGHEPSH